MNVLLLTSHSIAEYDDLRMLTDLGYNVFSIGAYTDPGHPTDDKRPALPTAAYFPGFLKLCEEVRAAHGEPGPAIDWAKAAVHPDILDWTDTIIVHHFPERWIADQWLRIRHKRVIWRTCGQSDPTLERKMRPYHDAGLQIVRYSPNEATAFVKNHTWAGQDAFIRFGKYPDDYGPWIGDTAAVGNVTQHMFQRGEACGYDRWMRYTAGLATQPAGPGSESIGGIGPLPYPAMLDYLRNLRAYLYLGTMPASYTLGLIEAMLSGVPVVAAKWQTPDQWLQDLWEADDIIPLSPVAEAVPQFLQAALGDREWAGMRGEEQRQRAVELFGIETVGPQWKAFLG